MSSDQSLMPEMDASDAQRLIALRNPPHCHHHGRGPQINSRVLAVPDIADHAVAVAHCVLQAGPDEINLGAAVHRAAC